MYYSIYAPRKDTQTIICKKIYGKKDIETKIFNYISSNVDAEYFGLIKRNTKTFY